MQFCAALCSLEGFEPSYGGEPPAVRGDALRGLFTPRWAELRQQYGIERPQGWRSEIYIHRLPLSQQGIVPWNRVLVTHDLWPDELVDDITGSFDDLRNQWPQVEWWVSRVHAAAASSRMPLLQHVNYVLISGEDFRAFAENPHGLMEFGFEEPQLFTTVLPRLINWPILRTFLAPLWAGMQAGITARAVLNGVALTHQLVECNSGFYLRINWGGNAYLVEQLEQMVSTHSLQLHQPPMIITGAHLSSFQEAIRSS